MEQANAWGIKMKKTTPVGLNYVKLIPRILIKSMDIIVQVQTLASALLFNVYNVLLIFVYIS